MTDDSPKRESLRTKDLRSYGYAPGAYSCHCQYCGNEFVGDKRAHTCKPCAEKRAAERPVEQRTSNPKVYEPFADESHIPDGWPQEYVGLHDYESARAEIERLMRELKILAPVGRYNGHDIEHWYSEAQRMRAALEWIRHRSATHVEAIVRAREVLSGASPSPDETTARRHDCPHCVCVVEEFIGRQRADVNAIISGDKK